MSYHLKEPSIPRYSQERPSKSTSEERKGLLSTFNIEDGDNGEPPYYEDEQYPKSRRHTPLRKKGIASIAASLIALILGASFLVPVSRAWCQGMGFAGRLQDPSRLFNNGTHDFKRTVLVVSIDGLR